MQPLKISLGLVTKGDITIETMMCVIHGIQNLSPHQVLLNFQKGTYIHDLRNRAFRDAVETNADYLMFIDSDVTFPPEAIKKLLDSNKDVIGASYNMKGLPLISTIKVLAPDGSIGIAEEKEVDPEPFIVYAVATGFMLIKMEKVRNMKFAFDFGTNPDGTMIGEDVNFCRRVREELELDVWCDPTIQVGHIGDYLY